MKSTSITVAVIDNCYDTKIKSYNIKWLRLIERLKKPEIRHAKKWQGHHIRQIQHTIPGC